MLDHGFDLDAGIAGLESPSAPAGPIMPPEVWRASSRDRENPL
jgi:hypothetical protein